MTRPFALALLFVTLGFASHCESSRDAGRTDDSGGGTKAVPVSAETMEPLEQHTSVGRDLPSNPKKELRYLFFLHGGIVEKKGLRPRDERFGIYEYEKILTTLESRGFQVVSEARASDTDSKTYAARVCQQIRTLLAAGVAPGNITVLGASKGAVIAMLISTELRNPDLNFVIMANCNDWVTGNHTIDLHGNILSIYDVNDHIGKSCQPFFDRATGLARSKEIELKIGTGHAILYEPLPKWVDEVERWAAIYPE